MTEQADSQELMHLFKTNSIKNDIALDPLHTPWCAAFVNLCERQAGHKGTGLVSARSFLNYGIDVPEEKAEEGDIVIFSRGNSSWQGHVTYFVRWNDDEGTVECLGGNQSDKVCIAAYPQDHILGIRRSVK